MVLIDGGTFPTCPAEEMDSAPGVVSESPCWSKSLADAIEAAKENWAEIQADLERAQAAYDALSEKVAKHFEPEWAGPWGIGSTEGAGNLLGPCNLDDCLRYVETVNEHTWVGMCRRCFPYPDEDDPFAADLRDAFDSCEGYQSNGGTAGVQQERSGFCHLHFTS